MEIKVDIELDDQFAFEVMTVMVESGPHALRYWSVVIDFDRLPEDLSVARIVIEEGEEGGERYTIDKDIVALGIQRLVMSAHKPEAVEVNDDLLGHLMRAIREDDPGEIDATLADCIAQAGTLGELRYS